MKLWVFGASLAGQSAVLYILANAFVLGLLWLLEVSAVVCDSSLLVEFVLTAR